MSSPDVSAIEVVRGRLSDERAAQLLEFWSRTEGLDDAAARERLGEVVCVLRDAGGEIVGENSVQAADVELIGGRRFWMYRSLLLPDVAEAEGWMLTSAFNALEAEFDPGAGGPVGLCYVIDEQAATKWTPHAKWIYPAMLYAGYLPDGRQVRIRYFFGARIAQAGPFG